MRITLLTRPDAGLFMGGAEIAVLRFQAALIGLGVEAEVLSPSTETLGDVVHMFSSCESHWSTAQKATELGKPYVWSPIFSSRRSETGERQRAARHHLTGRFPRKLRKLYRGASTLVASAPRERRQAIAYYGAPDCPFEVVPNGVDPRFASATPAEARAALGFRDPFVLHVGGYSETKNQLALIEAMKGTGVRTVFVGRVFEPLYLERCRKAADQDVVFLEDVPYDQSLLPSLYAAADVCCIPSLNETFLMAGVEAAAAGCSLVLGNGWRPEEVFGKYADYVNPHDPAAIRRAVLSKIGKPPADDRVEAFMSAYSWKSSAELLLGLYYGLAKKG